MKTPRYISACRYPSINELSRLSTYGPTTYGFHRSRHWIPNNSTHWDGSTGRRLRKLLLASVLVAILFGCLHCAAWNLHFPTPVERLLWRIAAMISVGVPDVAMTTNVSIVSIYTYYSSWKNIRFYRLNFLMGLLMYAFAVP